jgi:hypothetical protein
VYTYARCVVVSTLDETTKNALFAALERYDVAERSKLLALKTKDVKPTKENKGKVRAIVLETNEVKPVNGDKILKYVTFIVIDAAPGLAPQQLIRNGNKKDVALVSADGKSTTFFYTVMDTCENYRKVWLSKGVSVVDEVGTETSIVVNRGEVLHARLDGDTHATMLPFTVADFWLTFTICCSDPSKALRATDQPTVRVSKAIKASNVVRPANTLEVPAFFRANPRFCNLPTPSVAEIVRRSNYKHMHVVNDNDASKELSKETIYLPLLGELGNYVNYWGGGAGAIVLVEEDGTPPGAVLEANEKLMSAWEWHKFETPGEQNQMASLKGTLLQYTNAAELMNLLNNVQIGGQPPIFPKMTFTVTLYKDRLAAFHIEDLAMWMAMGKTIFWNVPMFLPTQVKLYPTCESPANNAQNDRFESQHLFLESKAPVADFSGELMNGLGLEMSQAGAWALLMHGKLEHGVTFTQKDFQGTTKRGDPINVNENPHHFMTNLIKSGACRFYALLSNFDSSQRAFNRDLSKYMQEHPEAAGGEVLLWPKWDPERPKQALAAMYDPAKLQQIGDKPIVVPTLDADHPIMAKQMRNVFPATGAKFILYAIKTADRRRLEEEAASTTGGLAETLREVMQARSASDAKAFERERQRALEEEQKQKPRELTDAEMAAEADAAEAAALLLKAKQRETAAATAAAAAAATSQLPPPPPPFVTEPKSPTKTGKRTRDGGDDDDDDKTEVDDDTNAAADASDEAVHAAKRMAHTVTEN